MQYDWQTIVAILIVVIAAAAIVRRFFVGEGSNSCGSGCGGCSSNKTSARQLFQLGDKSTNKNSADD